jgi:hypothetical protein
VQRSIKAEPAIVKFKSMTTLDLKGVMSRVKPGMVICDEKQMTLALRQRAKVEYRDFQKMQRQNEQMRKRLNKIRPSVPSSVVPPKLAVTDLRRIEPEK